MQSAAPTVVNYNDPTTRAKIIQFYEVLSLKWGTNLLL